jgi:hypothetical protein
MEEGTSDKVGTEVADRVRLSTGSPALPAWSSDDDWPEVPPVRPSLVATADVEAVSMTLAQLEGNASSGAGRAPGPPMVRS